MQPNFGVVIWEIKAKRKRRKKINKKHPLINPVTLFYFYFFLEKKIYFVYEMKLGRVLVVAKNTTIKICDVGST